MHVEEKDWGCDVCVCRYAGMSYRELVLDLELLAGRAHQVLHQILFTHHTDGQTQVNQKQSERRAFRHILSYVGTSQPMEHDLMGKIHL